MAAEWTPIAIVRLEAISTRVLRNPICHARWWLPALKASGYFIR